MKLKRVLSAVLAFATLTLGTASTVGSANAIEVETKDTPQASAATVETEAVQDAAPIYDYGLCDNIKDGAILHAWCWSFKTIEENMADIAAAGYTAVQTSPASMCYNKYPTMHLMGSDTTGRDGAWWWQYQPIELTVGNYQLGTSSDYQSMCETAHKYNVKIITDIVSNHTTAEKDENGNYAVTQNFIDNVIGEGAEYDVDEIYHKNYNNPRTDKSNRFQMINYQNSSMIDVNTENDKYQDYLVRYLNDLIALGCDGFRFDMAVNIGGIQYDKNSVASDRTGEEYDYWDIVTGKKAQNNQRVGKTSEDGTNLRKNADELFYYGEILGNDTYNHLSDYGEYISVTNSQYGNNLRDYINSNNFSVSNVNNWASHPLASQNKIITWVESHDTYLNEHDSAKLTDWQIRACWAVIAARSGGTPLFFNRPDGSDGASGNYWGNNELGAKGNDQFKHPEVTAVNRFRNAMSKADASAEQFYNINSNSKILQIDRYRTLNNTEDTCGTCIINLSTSDVTINTETKLSDGEDYYDMVSGNKFTVENSKISGKIKAQSIAVIYKSSRDIIMSASANSDSFTDTLSVDLTLINAPSNGTYTVTAEDNVVETNTFTNGDKITITGGSDVTVKDYKPVTLTLKATDSNQKEITRSYTYKKLKSSSGGDMYIYFDNSTYNYSDIRVLLYNGSSKNGDDNGQKMDYDSETGYYKYKVPDDMKKYKCVFLYSGGQYPAYGTSGILLDGKSKLFTAGNSMVDYTGQFIDTNSQITDDNYIYYFNTTLENNIIATLSNGTTTRDISMQYNNALHCYFCKYDSNSNYSTVQFSNGSNHETQFVSINPGKVYVPTSYSRGKWIEPCDIEERKVYFKNSLNWSKVYAHMWNGNDTVFDKWPGVEMTLLGTVNGLGDNIYCLTYYYPATSSTDDDYRSVIFNNGSGTQTVDLTIPLNSSEKPLLYELGEKITSGTDNGKYPAEYYSIDSKLNFTTINKTLNVTFKYYDHKVSTSDSSSNYQEETYFKTVPVTVESSTIENAIVAASESMDDCNLYETYCYHTSEFDYIKSIATDTNEDRLGNKMNYASKINPDFFTKYTSAFSGIYADTIGSLSEAQENSKWVTYYNENTEIDYNNINPDLSNVTRVEVWLVNEPKKNYVTFYYPTAETELTSFADDKLFVAKDNSNNNSNVKDVSYGCNYNQLLSSNYEDFAKLTSDMYMPAVNNVQYVFDGWYMINFNSDNSVKSYVKVSSEKEYKYRLTSGMKLYAVFAKSVSNTKGAVALANDVDKFTDVVDDSEVAKYRFNTMLNVYNCSDYDKTANTNITDVAVIYVKLNQNSTYNLSSIREELSTKVSSDTGNVAINDGTASFNSYRYKVGSAVQLTAKNRIQFILTLKASQAIKDENNNPGAYSNILAFTAFKYNNGNWIISDNCINYKNSEPIVVSTDNVVN